MIYIEKCHLSLKFLDNPPILLANLCLNDETWHHLTLCFLSQNPNLTEFELFLNGISVETRILNSSPCFSNGDLFLNSQLLLGYDPNSNSPSDNSSEYYKLGPFRLFLRALSQHEVNLLYCISNSSGGLNFFSDTHSINWPLVSLSNLRFFDLVQHRKDHRTPISFSRLQVSAKLMALTEVLALDCDMKGLTVTKQREPFQMGLRAPFSKNGFKTQGMINAEFVAFVLNRANDSFLAQGYILPGNKDDREDFIVYREFLGKEMMFPNGFLGILEKSNFLFTLFELLEKTENECFFLRIYHLFINLLEKSEFLSERFEAEGLWKVVLELLKRHSEFFGKELLQSLLALFCKKIAFQGRNMLTSSVSSLQPSHYWLLNSIKIGRAVMMDTDLQSLLGRSRSSIRIDFLDSIIFELMDPNRNLFSK